MNILHISDVHFGGDDQDEQVRITESLIEAVHKDGTRPDLCVFSGDLTHSATSEQFQEGQKWLKSLILQEWNTTLLLVPGNHDIARPATQPTLFRTYAKDKNTYKEWRKGASKSHPHLDSFFRWLSSATDTLPIQGEWQAPFGFYHCMNIARAHPVHIIGLNSALFSCNDSDSGNLVIDIKILNTYLARARHERGFVIALSHHPLNNLIEWNRTEIETILSQIKGVDLLLHGHTHEQIGVYKADSTGAALTTLSVGACYQGARWPQFFCFYSIDSASPVIHSVAYSYSRNSGEWVFDPARSQDIRTAIPPFDISFPAHSISKPEGVGTAEHRASDKKSSKIKPPQSEPVQIEQIPTQERIELQARRYRDAAIEVQKHLLPYFRNNGLLNQYYYALKHRIKDLQRIRVKYIEKLKVKDDYTFFEMDDICGFRIVTTYLSDIPRVVARILEAIENIDHNDKCYFVKGAPTEIDIYTSRPESDPLSVISAVKKSVAASKLQVDINPTLKQTGYSSVHISTVVAVPPQEPGGVGQIKIEIQIRTALEDVWSEIDHKLRYGGERGGIGVSWKRHLNVVKAQIDGLVSYVDLIKTIAEEESVKSPTDTPAARSISVPESQMALLRNLPYPQKSRIAQAFELWKQADTTQKYGGHPGRFRKAADAFLSALNDYRGEPKDKPDLADDFSYICEGEAAYLLIYTGDPDDLREAEAIYNNILATPKRSKDITSYYRLGRIFSRQGLFEKSLEAYNSCLKFIEDNVDRQLNKTHWIYDAARLGLSITQWNVFKNLNSVAAIESAIDLADDVIKNPGEHSWRIKCMGINDLLFYLWAAKRNPNSEYLFTRRSGDFYRYREELYDKIFEEGEYDLARLDTLGRIWEDDKDHALKIAECLEGVLERSALDQDSVRELPDRGTALWVAKLLKNLNEEQKDALILSQELISKYRT